MTWLCVLKYKDVRCFYFYCFKAHFGLVLSSEFFFWMIMLDCPFHCKTENENHTVGKKVSENAFFFKQRQLKCV